MTYDVVDVRNFYEEKFVRITINKVSSNLQTIEEIKVDIPQKLMAEIVKSAYRG